ncbi:MAG: DEAD/DEAH box helicase [Campylobacterota bacterium]
MNKLIVNSQSSNLYNYIIKLLNECNSFTINVAFINFSGVQLLLNCFKELEKKGVKGKILTSTYLNFTEAKALYKLLEFKNIELKIYDSNLNNKGFHSKAYIFEFDNEYKTVIGSSNITSSAFKSNIEWNQLYTCSKDDIFLKELQKEFNILWNESLDVNFRFISQYEKQINNLQIDSDSYENEIKVNSMQENALQKLTNLRKQNENKALVIAATGTGKTYLAAFDVKNYQPKKLLFLAHRENILIKAKESFKNINKKVTLGLFSGRKKELKCDYLFATIQSMLNNTNLFNKNEFDYIIVDEAHHISSNSYIKILRYFNYSFLLGLTATPSRMDNQNIYDYFDDNVACNIRIQEALDSNLIVPFHYYGIKDASCIDYEGYDLNNIKQLTRLLMVNRRVDYIIEKMKFYGFSGIKRKVLAFCISKEHCIYMKNEFNSRGIISESLTSEDSILTREEAIAKLQNESDSLEVIFCVDIFNEGVDIPSINTILMLRPTDSSIIFTQQLGRGLRKYNNKEFLTVIDFIGNYKRAFLIAIAMLGDKKIDKDSVKISVVDNFAILKNAHINFDSISKERILKQIDNQNFNSFSFLKESYFKFKELLGKKIPMMSDYLAYDDLLDPLKFINYSKSYIEFLLKIEDKKEINCFKEDIIFIKIIRFIEYLLPIKRVYEFVILQTLLENRSITKDFLYKKLQKRQEVVDMSILNHAIKFLEQDFFDSSQLSKYEKLIYQKNEKIYKTSNFINTLKCSEYKKFINESLVYGIMEYEKRFSNKYYGVPFFKLYEQYNMMNIAQLSNFDKIHSSFRGSGFLKFKNDFFLFITIEKDKFSKAAKYQNSFTSKDIFSYFSKPTQSSHKGDGLKLVHNKKYDIKLHIFVRKFVEVDKKRQKFIYLGLANTLSHKNSKPVEVKLKLEKPLTDKLFEEFTKLV